MTQPQEKPTTVFIADDHTLVRLGIQMMLGQLGGYAVVGEAANGQDALAACLRLLPDIIIMDVAMPIMSGIDVATQLREQGVSSRLIMLSGDERPETVQAALRAGSRGYLAKDALLAELEIALEAIRNGKSYVSPSVADILIALSTTAQEEPPLRVDHSLIAGLTNRQRDVLKAIALGRSNKEIARELDVSPKTVEFHRAEIMQRLDVHELATLVRIAIKAGLIEDR